MTTALTAPITTDLPDSQAGRYILAISEIAEFSELHVSTVTQMVDRYNWQPTGERVRGGGDKYDIDKNIFYKSQEKHEALKQKIKDKIREAEKAAKHATKTADQDAMLKRLGVDPGQVPTLFEVEERERDMMAYLKASMNNRAIFDKYSWIEDQAGHLKGKKLRGWINNVWKPAHPGETLSYEAVMLNRKKLKKGGKAAVIGKLGSQAGWHKTKDEWQEHFNRCYLVEGGPSIAACWRIVVGRFCQGGDLTGFPMDDTFINRLRREIGESAIYMQRYGFAKWDRKFGYYIDRDYSQLRPGEAWVSDHAQLDILVINPETGKPCCAWVTSWIDFRTDKVLSSSYHCAPPNSDHIFQSFQIAVDKYGIPNFIYIDNGRDYRCKDFAGGRPVMNLHKVTVDENTATPMLSMLGVKAKFALPYNAKSKTIEILHKRIKEDYSVFVTGYRGGNVTERPEQLAKDVKAGNLLNFEEVRAAYYEWIETVYNKTVSDGKKLQGQSPDDAWNLANPIKRMVSQDALALFMMRSSKVYTIGRNGIKDSKNGLTYWSEFMIGRNGEKVVLRRNPENLNRAWVMSPDNERCLGTAMIAGLVPALAMDEIGQQAVSDAIATQRHIIKATKALGTVARKPEITEIINDKAAAARVLNPDAVPEPEKRITEILPNNPMQRIVNEEQKRQQIEQAGAELMPKLVKEAEIRALEEKRAKVRSIFCQTKVDKEDKNAMEMELTAEIERLKAMGQ